MSMAEGFVFGLLYGSFVVALFIAAGAYGRTLEPQAEIKAAIILMIALVFLGAALWYGLQHT